MKTVYLVTTNSGKVISFQNALEQYPIRILKENVEVPEIQSHSLAEIARSKALLAFNRFAKPVVAMDGGFFIHDLGGFPGPYSKYILETIGLAGILRLVEGRDRSCEFRSALAYMDAWLPEPVIFNDSVGGTIAKIDEGMLKVRLAVPRPHYMWSDFGYIVIPDGLNRTMMELTPQEYADWREELRQQHSYYRDFADFLLHR